MIQATLILACAWGVARMLGRRSSAERHMIWAAALGAAAVVPLLSVLLGAWQPNWARAVAEIFPAIVRSTSPNLSSSGADVVVHASALEGGSRTLVNAVAMIWAIGAGIALVVLLAGALRLARFAALARPVADASWQPLMADLPRRLSIRQRVRFLQSATASIPMTWGFRHPCVVLPRDAEAWSDDRRRVVLAHELAHVRRHDWLVQILAAIVCAVYWFHPLFWFAYRRLRNESEHACDDVVVNLGVNAQDYASHLLQIVRAARTDDRQWRSALAMARSSQLEERFAALLVAARNRRPVNGRLVGAVAAVTIAFVIPLAAMGLAPLVDATIRVQTASLPSALDVLTASADAQPTSAIRRVRTVDVFTADSAVIPPDVAEYTTPPLYSDEARRRHIEGIVTIDARIGTDGRVTAPRVISGLGFGLDQNALVALRQWQFRPGTQGGRPIAMTAEIDIEFNLRNEALNELIANDMATRIGPDVTAPRIISRVNVPAPSGDGVQRRAGTVVLDVILMQDGTPKIVRVLQSLTPQLDEQAIETFEQWRFSPAEKAGQPVKVRLQADITFH